MRVNIKSIKKYEKIKGKAGWQQKQVQYEKDCNKADMLFLEFIRKKRKIRRKSLDIKQLFSTKNTIA